MYNKGTLLMPGYFTMQQFPIKSSAERNIKYILITMTLTTVLYFNYANITFHNKNTIVLYSEDFISEPHTQTTLTLKYSVVTKMNDN